MSNISGGVARLVLFDLDDTLVDRSGAFRVWAREFVAEHRLDAVALAFLLRAEAEHSGPMGGYFETVRHALGLAPTVERLWACYRWRMPELATCRPGNHAALVRLRRAGWRIGIVTNGMTDSQLSKLRRTGLSDVVDGWCVSEEAGLRKPDPAIFRLAAERCGVRLRDGDPLRGWMVGDNLDHDVRGARAAGLRTVWLRQGRRPLVAAPDAGRPNLTVSTVAQAVDAILRQDQRA